MTYVELNQAITEFKESLRKDISAIPTQIEGVKQLGPNVQTMSILLLQREDNWSPAYYNIAQQKKYILEMIEGKSIEATLAILKSISESKSGTKIGTQKIVFHKNVCTEIRKLLKKVGYIT